MEWQPYLVMSAPGTWSLEFKCFMAGRYGRKLDREIMEWMATVSSEKSAPGTCRLESIPSLAGRNGRIQILEFKLAMATVSVSTPGR